MSDAEEKVKIVPSDELPPQVSPTDTSNQDNKAFTDPSGEKYIRTTDEGEN